MRGPAHVPFDGDWEALRACFPKTEPHRGKLPGLSGVLLPLFGSGTDLSLLYEKRAEDLRAHAGEVCFPGGRVDPHDASPLAAALREAEEEVGLAPDRVDVLGHLTDYLTFRGNHVCAYVGHAEGPPPAGPTSREVAEAFTVPVADLLRPGAYESRAMPGGLHRVHYFHVKPHVVWGITGELTARFLEKAYGWTPPVEPRVIDDISEYLP